MESFFIDKRKKKNNENKYTLFLVCIYILKYSIRLFYYYKTLDNFNIFFFSSVSFDRYFT